MRPGSCLVIGGGIGGLTVAFRLHEAGVPVRLLEASSRFGGVITTEARDGWLFEYGPNTVTTADAAVEPLVTAAGLESERLTASTAGARRYIVKGGRLVALPGSPPEFFSSPIFSPGAKLRLAAEPFLPRGKDADESIADFVRRRLGREMLDYAVGPFVSGVYAGDPEQLAVRHAVSRIHALEEKHGSLIRGAMALKKARGGKMATGPSGGLLSFRHGLSALPERLAERLGAGATPGMTVNRLERANGGWRVHAGAPGSGSEILEAAQLVLAIDAPAMARLLQPLDSSAAGLADVPAAGVVVTALGYRREDVGHPLDGFGFLAPRVEKVRPLGVLFPSSLFPGRAPEGHVALTAIAGGATDPVAVEMDDATLLDMLRRELGPLLDLKGPPVYHRSVRWRRAIPQYNRGHQRFLDLAGNLESHLPGLHLLGSWRGGVSVGDRIGRATALAERLAAGGSAA